MIVVIEESWPSNSTLAQMVEQLRALQPRLILVDMCGPQASYLRYLEAEGFTARPLPKAVKRRVE